MDSKERSEALGLVAALSRTALGAHLILGGSSGLYGVSPTIPALTEDIDFLIDADWVAAHEAQLFEEMRSAGFRHHAGSCTFTDQRGFSIDLVGYSRRDREDRIGGGATVPVMVYADLSMLMADPGAVVPLPGGGKALSAAALAAVKLLTIRVEKGGKDKIQALLLIQENAADEQFLRGLTRLMRAFPEERVEDAVADAQAALLSLSADTLRGDASASGYTPLTAAAQTGLRLLQQLFVPGAGRA